MTFVNNIFWGIFMLKQGASNFELKTRKIAQTGVTGNSKKLPPLSYRNNLK